MNSNNSSDAELIALKGIAAKYAADPDQIILATMETLNVRRCKSRLERNTSKMARKIKAIAAIE